MPEPVQIDITKKIDVDKATETKYKASVNSTVKSEGTEKHSRDSMVIEDVVANPKPSRVKSNVNEK